MSYDFGDDSLPARSNFSIQALCKVQPASNQFPPPTFVADAVLPERFAGERRVWLHSISDEAVGCVSVHSKEEWDEEVMCVPESLERLLAYPMMCCGVHEEHTQQHDVASNAAGLCIVDLYRRLRPDLVALHVEEVDIMCRDVENGEEQEAVRALAVKPL